MVSIVLQAFDKAVPLSESCLKEIGKLISS
jgi:hypothetical protein